MSSPERRSPTTGRSPAALRRCAVTMAELGSPKHGVVAYGRKLAAAFASTGVAVRVLPLLPDPAGTLAAAVAPSGLTHLHVSDSIPGVDLHDVTEALMRPRRGRVIVTLHDVPGTETETESADPTAGRRARYAAIITAADRVVVCSTSEAARLRRWSDCRPSVIPHLVELCTAPTEAAADGRVAVLGYIYPGKGHELALRAVAQSASRPPIVFLGGAAPGHRGLVADHGDLARDLGVSLAITGWLDEGSMRRAVAAASVPLVVNRTPSASGSLSTWLAAHRRPIVARTSYAEEVEGLVPGIVELSDSHPGGLAAAIDRHLATPQHTHASVDVGPMAPDAVAGAHRDLYLHTMEGA